MRRETMLPSELLVVWKRKGVIWPRYAKQSEDNLEVANGLIEVYKRHVGEKKRVLKEFVGELEDSGYDYRFVRGLSFLLDRRSVFKCSDRVNPIDLRRKIYNATEKLGLPTTPEQRSRIIEAVALEQKLTPDMVEEFFYADLDSELILERFDALPSPELLEEYNLSLTQTLLFDATELNFTASGDWQRIFYAIKKLGLIYEAYQDGRFKVKIDGPASLFKLTRRYGTAMAKLLPVVIANPEWSVEAKILWKYTNEICDFKIESWKHRAMLKKPQLPTVSYDSSVEEDFAQHFQALKSEWHLKREPDPILAGKQVIIADFSLEREGIRVYVEIVGFWTVEYLLRKIEKLKKVEVKMLVIVNESLACGKLADLVSHPQLNIIYYRDRVPLSPILRHLEEAFRGVEVKQEDLLMGLPMIFTEPVVNYEEFAARIGVSVEAVRKALTEKAPTGYTVMANCLARKDTLEQIGKRLQEQASRAGRLPLSEAVKIVETEGVEDAYGAIETLGYKIVWRGISIEKAEVIKPENQKNM
jgi:predicted nuclease of restriction endonuclease-like RecB superfamily